MWQAADLFGGGFRGVPSRKNAEMDFDKLRSAHACAAIDSLIASGGAVIDWRPKRRQRKA